MIWLDLHGRCLLWQISTRRCIPLPARRPAWLRGFQLLGLALLLSSLSAAVAPALPVRDTNQSLGSNPNLAPTVSVLDPTNGLGSWIWATNTYNKQSCRLWKSFEIPAQATVQRALLRVTADNGYRLMFDGRQVGQGSDWRSLSEYDLTWLLFPGLHVLAIEGFNDQEKAGVIVGLRVEMADGKVIELGSDETWFLVPETERGWERRTQPLARWGRAMVVGAMGAHPWWSKPTSIDPVPALRPVVLQFWQTVWFQIALLSGCGTVVLICLRLMAKLALQSRAQQLLQLERARIARDIHDDLGAGLTQLVLLGEVTKSGLPAASETREQIDQLCERARDLSRTMDEIVWAVNSRRDTLRDFATYVCKYAQAFLRSTPIRCRLDVEPELATSAFDLPIRRNLLLAVKEALHNAAKHSEATELFLRIHRCGDGLLVVVEDNGKGFDLARASQERNGLTNMAQRMSEVGGTFRLSGQPGTGCRVEFNLPVLHASSRWLRRRTSRSSQRVEQPANPSAVVSEHSPSSART
jgi:signal transduction histidine kinase